MTSTFGARKYALLVDTKYKTFASYFAKYVVIYGLKYEYLILLIVCYFRHQMVVYK